ncbi:MAG: SH3 domain-containing protein [Polyangiaceae bacterium]
MTQDRIGPSVHVPKPGDDQPRLVRVAVITAIGFAVGVIWPKVAGMKLVPSVPSEAEGAASAASADPQSAPGDTGAPAAPPAAKAQPASAQAPESAPTPEEAFKISEPKITSCRDAKGARREKCDAIEIDAAARPKILALSACPAAKDLQGTLSLGIELDFASGKISDVMKGKSTSLPDATADALIACAKREFMTLSLSDIQHEQSRYTVFYIAEFLPPGKAATPDAGASVTPASGHATVGWEVAIVRDQPKDGEIVARLMRGTKVVVTGRDGDWYRVKYDAKGAEGWVFRTAIGM